VRKFIETEELKAYPSASTFIQIFNKALEKDID